MVFSSEEYDLVEKILLNGNHFNSQQKSFIELFESKTIIAGPGAGKTTSLAAKIILLLRYLNYSGSREGVCIITHTNVAVNEINIALQKAGIKSISHPHFIGTIHEFFNRFCVIPYFKKEYGNNTLVFDSLKSNDLEFYKRYIGIKMTWIKQEKYKKFYDRIVRRVDDNPLFFNKELKNIDMRNKDEWDKFEKYKKNMLEAKFLRKKQGFLQYEDTFLFSKIFLEDTKYQHILRKRFKYIFVDEFQDTTLDGITLLNKIFNKPDNIIQMLGDPYQTIMYGQSMPKLQEDKLFRINLSNRFGEEISSPLNQIIPMANIQVQKEKESFKPIILIYQDEQSIYSTYKNILDEYELRSQKFKECKKDDKVLIRNKAWASRVKEGLIYSQKNTIKKTSKNIELKKMIIDFICGKVINEEIHPQDLRKWVTDHPKIYEMNSILLNIFNNNLNDDNKTKIRDTINYLLTEKKQEKINNSNPFFREFEKILCESEDEKEQNFSDINDVFTIHSVKGETLRSALIVNFENGPFINILFHQYGILNEGNYTYTDKNLLYVALSRVAYLFVFAIHKDEITEEGIKRLESHWEIRKVNK